MRRFFDPLSMCWVCEDAPQERNFTFVAPICKMGEEWNNENYRVVSSAHYKYKIWWNLITLRINALTECMLEGLQEGFRKFCKWETRVIQLTGSNSLLVYEKAFDIIYRSKPRPSDDRQNLFRMPHISFSIARNNKKLEIGKHFEFLGPCIFTHSNESTN